MLDSVEDYWDIAHIMMNGKFAATMTNDDREDSKRLEQMFFEITEGGKDNTADASEEESIEEAEETATEDTEEA